VCVCACVCVRVCACRLPSTPLVPVSALTSIEPRPPTTLPMVVSRVPMKSWSSKFVLLLSLRWSEVGGAGLCGWFGGGAPRACTSAARKPPTQLHTLRATRTSATCAQSCGRAGRLRIVDEEFEMLLLLKGVVHLKLLFEHRIQVVLDDFSSANLLPKPVWRLELDLKARRHRARSVSRCPENRLTQPLHADDKPMCVNEWTGHRPSAAQVFKLNSRCALTATQPQC